MTAPTVYWVGRTASYSWGGTPDETAIIHGCARGYVFFLHCLAGTRVDRALPLPDFEKRFKKP